MTSIIVRGLDESVKKRLAARAAAHGRSMEAEARDILTNAVGKPNIGFAFMEAAQEAGGFEDLPLPERNDVARAVDAEIAAICQVHGAICATRNTKDFEYTGIGLINPWSE